MGFYNLTRCWKPEKSKRKPKTRSVHTQTDNGSPQQSPPPPPQQSSSPPSYPPPPVPTSSPSYPPPPLPTSRDKGKGIVIEEGKKCDKGKGIVIDDGKKQHYSSDSDFDSTPSERSGTSRYYIPQYASNVENPPPPPSNPPSEYGFPWYSDNYNPQQGYHNSSYPNYQSTDYSQSNYHPDKTEISEYDKPVLEIYNEIFGNC